MNDRDCDNCAHHSDGGCSVWECSFEQKDDTISRQTAIDALHDEIVRRRIDEDTNDDGALDEFDTEEILRQLPSAQPTEATCWGCNCQKMERLETLLSAQRTQTDTSNTLKSLDCVERQAAIDALKRNTLRLTVAEEWNCEGHVAWDAEVVYSEVMEGMLLDLPSAQQWIPCSERPPEEDEQVFVYLFDDSPYIAWICGGRWHTEEFMLDKDEEPEAWMPLPKKYSGDEK